MKSDEIQKRSFGYWLFRFYTIFVHRLYYKEIVVLGRENIPRTDPVIFTPNHQNALMDALAVACTVPQQLVFLARADLFQRPFLAKILTFFKIMPVYRIRDGYGNLSRNEECFVKAIAILRERKSICLMPEGNHGNQRRLRPFAKGIFRIAFRAQAEKEKVPFVKIVPVGLDYSHYAGFRTRLIIQFGRPIDVSLHFPAYQSNPARAYKDLCDHLRSEMKSLMLHVESAGHYETSWALKDIYRDAMFQRSDLGAKSTINMFSVDQKILELLDKKAIGYKGCMSQIEANLVLHKSLLRELKLRPWVLNSDGGGYIHITGKSILCLLGVPVFIYGLLNNGISYCMASWISTLPRDRQFRSSLRFGAEMFLAPLVGVFQTLLLFWYCHSFLLCVMYLVSIVVSRIVAFDLYIETIKLISIMRYRTGLHLKWDKYLALRQAHQDIVGFLDALID
jgi:1-acyl-sn-glycerol-3-phosphate acyltransferase